MRKTTLEITKSNLSTKPWLNKKLHSIQSNKTSPHSFEQQKTTQSKSSRGFDALRMHYHLSSTQHITSWKKRGKRRTPTNKQPKINEWLSPHDLPKSMHIQRGRGVAWWDWKGKGKGKEHCEVIRGDQGSG